jgi:hypothetical protein
MVVVLEVFDCLNGFRDDRGMVSLAGSELAPSHFIALCSPTPPLCPVQDLDHSPFSLGSAILYILMLSLSHLIWSTYTPSVSLTLKMMAVVYNETLE